MKFCPLLLALILESCAMNTGTGVLTGGVIGAISGGIAGSGKGAFIGSATGIIAGGLIGAVLDEQDRQLVQKNSPRTVDRMDRQEPLTLNDVIKLSQSGVSDEAIIRYITDTCSAYTLSQTQVRRLRDGGVSQRVINAMGSVSS